MKYEKKALLGILISNASQELERMTEATDKMRQSAIDAPGRMESRYDSSKQEYSYLADSMNARRIELNDALSALQQFDLPENQNSVDIGTLVKLMDESAQKVNSYFVLPAAGGEYIETEEGEVTIITQQAPLCAAMMGLKKDDVFTFIHRGKDRIYKIIDIQ
ncbi:MAG: GreA/GreB family elongation factor [Nanoarchaeota archaeon]